MKSHFQLLHSMKQVKGRLLELQGMLHMLQLLSGYLPPSHFARFCRVWLGHKLHCLCPTIVKYLPEVLLQGTYKGCNVLLDAPVVDRSSNMSTTHVNVLGVNHLVAGSIESIGAIGFQ